MPLPAVGVLTYNGYSFDGSSKITVKRTNVRDEADRTTVYVLHDINVKAIVATGDGSSTSTSMDAIYTALTCEGGVLQLQNSGFGTALIVNLAGAGNRDVKWGPKPQMITWSPIGSHGAAEIEWSCKVAVGPCSETTGKSTGIMALNYEVTFDIDEHGDTVRTISGYYEIAQTRVNNAQPCSSRVVGDSADNVVYRNQIAPELPLSFTRTQSWKVSKDRSRMDFSLVDRQIPSPNPYPPGFTSATGSHSLRMTRANMARNRCSLRLSLTAQRSVSPAAGWAYFKALFNQRRTVAEQAGFYILVQEVTFEEDLFGRTAHFGVEYVIYGKKEIPPLFTDPIGKSGMWTVLPGKWEDWRTSMFTGVAPSGAPFGPRGNAGLVNGTANDIIIDLCGAPFANPASPVNPESYQKPNTADTTFQNKLPDPSGSYLHYQSAFVILDVINKAIHTILQDDGSTASQPNTDVANPGGPVSPPVTSQAQVDGLNREIAQGAPSIASVPIKVSATIATGGTPLPKYPDVIQVRGLTNHRIRFYGACVRVGYLIPRPSVQKVNGVPVYEVGHPVYNHVLTGTCFGMPIYQATWDIIYHVPLGIGPNTKLDLDVKNNDTPVSE